MCNLFLDTCICGRLAVFFFCEYGFTLALYLVWKDLQYIWTSYERSVVAAEVRVQIVLQSEDKQ